VISFEESESSDLIRIKLYEPAPGESADYVSLSYCWGHTGQAMTLMDLTKDRLFSGVDIADLGDTIKDAIKVTRRLGIPYLWVDSLCIFQDDKVAMQREIDNMTDIYKNATIVLVAASAKSVEEGFLYRKPASNEICRFPVTLSNKLVDIHMLPRMMYDPIFKAPSHPLDTRAWTMQECALATRMLVYSESEVFWHCADACHQQLVQSHLTLNPHGQFAPGDTFGVHMKFSRLKHAFWQGGDEKWIEHWHDLVEEYTKRNMSNPDDRLNALKGIADDVANITDEAYLHGAWSGSFAQCLAWRNMKPSETRHRSFRAPSWSWACINQRIEMNGRKIRPVVDFLFHNSAPFEAKAVFGEDEGGPLELRTKYLGAVLLRGPLMPEFDGLDLGTYYPDIEGESPEGSTFSLLLGSEDNSAEGIDIIFARLVEIEDSNYKRIGLRVLTTKSEEIHGIVNQWDIDSWIKFFWLV
jgi:hypothetical protein